MAQKTEPKKEELDNMEDTDPEEECDSASSSSLDLDWDMEEDFTCKDLIQDIAAREMLISLVMSSKFREAGKLKVTLDGLWKGRVLAWSVPPTDEEYLDIKKYVDHSQEQRCGKIEVKSVLRIVSKADDFRDFDEPQHKGKLRMMLFHGTSTDAVVSILQNGLVLPNSHGQMFGSGIYFADRASKSVNYCGSTGTKSEYYMFLCEVLLGAMYESKGAEPSLTAPPSGFDSVKGLGRLIPDSKANKTVDGCVWPLGPTVRNTETNVSLQWNEYIVYRSAQVQPKYLIKFALP